MTSMHHRPSHRTTAYESWCRRTTRAVKQDEKDNLQHLGQSRLCPCLEQLVASG